MTQAGPGPNFADRLIATTRQHGVLCVGIDPHAALVPSLFGPPCAKSAEAWSLAVVEACAGRVAVVKPQAAFYERWGSKGMAALETVCAAATKAGLLVILDAKRGDMGSTSEAYAEAYLSEAAEMKCDAMTVNPYLGLDAIEPYVAMAERTGKGVVVLARTSNPGSKDFQARLVDGQPLYLHVARALNPMGKRLKGRTSDWSGLMLVAGATGPQEAAQLRAAAPDALFLVPGYGAQGAGARDALAGFRAGPSGLEGGVVSASRSVSLPAGAKDATTARDWETAVRLAIDAAKAELAEAARS